MELPIIKTLCGMEVKILPKQENIPTFDPKAIRQGLNIYLYLDPYGEVEQFEVNCDGEWLAIGFSSHGGTKDEKNYYSYNPEYAGVEEFAHVQSGGQSPIEKYLALTNIEVGIKAVEYFIRTGKLYPGIDWAEQL